MDERERLGKGFAAFLIIMAFYAVFSLLAPDIRKLDSGTLAFAALILIGVFAAAIFWLERRQERKEKALVEKLRNAGGFTADPQFPSGKVLYRAGEGVRMYYETGDVYKGMLSGSHQRPESTHKFVLSSDSKIRNFSVLKDGEGFSASGDASGAVMPLLLNDADARAFLEGREAEIGTGAMLGEGNMIVMRVKTLNAPATWIQQLSENGGEAGDNFYADEMAEFVKGGFGLLEKMAKAAKK